MYPHPPVTSTVRNGSSFSVSIESDGIEVVALERLVVVVVKAGPGVPSAAAKAEVIVV